MTDDIETRIWKKALEIGFIPKDADLPEGWFEDFFTNSFFDHLVNNRIEATQIQLFDSDLKKSSTTFTDIVENYHDKTKITLQFEVVGSDEDKWDSPTTGGEYWGTEIDFNELKPDILYQNKNAIVIIEAKLGAKQSWKYKYEERHIYDQFARYTDWLIAAKVNKNFSKKYLIILTDRAFASTTEDKLPSELKKMLEFNNRSRSVKGMFMFWEDIFGAFRKKITTKNY